MTRTLLVTLLTLALLLPALPAVAHDTGWSVTLGLPISYEFTKDEQTGTAPDAKNPVGLRSNVKTPINLGVGLAHYESGFVSTDTPWFGRDIAYNFLELQFVIPIGPVWLAPGFGLGSAEFSPAKIDFGPGTQEFLKSSAQEWYLLAAYRIVEHWDVQLGAHFLKVDLDYVIEVGNERQEASGDLGATMYTLGGGYHF